MKKSFILFLILPLLIISCKNDIFNSKMNNKVQQKIELLQTSQRNLDTLASLSVLEAHKYPFKQIIDKKQTKTIYEAEFGDCETLLHLNNNIYSYFQMCGEISDLSEFYWIDTTSQEKVNALHRKAFQLLDSGKEASKYLFVEQVYVLNTKEKYSFYQRKVSQEYNNPYKFNFDSEGITFKKLNEIDYDEVFSFFKEIKIEPGI